MALTWDWKDKMGEVIDKNGTKANLYQGNALIIAIYEHQDNTYDLAWFFIDEAHMKNMLGLTKGYNNCMEKSGIKKLKLDTRYKSIPKIVSAFAKAKMKIEIKLYVGKETKK